MNPPLAEQLRPQQLSDYIGQSHLMGEGAVLQKAIRSGTLPSMILWGPPGVGKTTLAYLISLTLKRPFFTLSAVQSGVKEVREVLLKAEAYLADSRQRQKTPSLFEASDESAESSEKTPAPPILFIDEIHRFSKSQQDSLLAAVEKGTVTFIGATTENPSFEVITPLLSRCQVYVLKSLSSEELDLMIERAVAYIERQLGWKVEVRESAALKRLSGGDGRKLLNALDIVVSLLGGRPDAAPGGPAAGESGAIVLTDRIVGDIIQQNIATYDRDGENHYDLISAFIKSMRGSDPNAAVYYLGRMLAGGEDPKFIARRMLILASEDIGNANPNALLLANACFDTVHKIGYPECRITLSQTAIYLACSPKSNAAYMAIDVALEKIKQTGDLPVPLQIRNAPTSLMKDLGYGQNYRYAHDYEGNFADMEFLPAGLEGFCFYNPGDNPKEREIRQHLHRLWREKYGY
ncbi:MAG: replication-associated recombination protein A [Bacteroidales bacterium]|nr:replication-associated recombination protein A [Bacteroidales bacterium]